MMRKSGSRLLPVWMLLAGGAALAMRAGLYALAVDAKGLVGALTGGLSAAAGGTAAALVFGLLAAAICRGGKPRG